MNNNRNRPVSINGVQNTPSGYIPRNAQRSSSGNWRDKMAADVQEPQQDMLEQFQAMQLAQLQMQQQQYLNKQQELYQLQQAQMSMQLEAMQRQNMEIQERLYATMQPAVGIQRESPDPVNPNRRSALLNGLRKSSGDQLSSDSSFDGDDSMTTRRGLIQNLVNTQKNRLSGDFSPPQANVPLANGERRNRLSFNGGDGLAERALARKTAYAVTTPPPTQTQFDIYPFPANMTPSSRQHHRNSSSLSSATSEILSESRKRIVSPSGPTLVLSSPGEAFPSPTLGRSNRARRLTVNTDNVEEVHERKGESGESSGTSTPSSETSEVLSFESNTSSSTHAQPSKAEVKKVASVAVLNPSAPAFTPSVKAVEGTATPPMMARHGRTSSLSTFSPPSFSSVMLGTPGVNPNAGIYRSFSPPATMAAVSIIRQPKGPANEDEFDSKNFAIRKRRRDFSTQIKTKLRGASPCSSLPSL